MRVSTEKDVIYIIKELNGDDFKFNINSDKLEKLCIDLQKECLKKIKLKKQLKKVN